MYFFGKKNALASEDMNIVVLMFKLQAFASCIACDTGMSLPYTLNTLALAGPGGKAGF